MRGCVSCPCFSVPATCPAAARSSNRMCPARPADSASGRSGWAADCSDWTSPDRWCLGRWCPGRWCLAGGAGLIDTERRQRLLIGLAGRLESLLLLEGLQGVLRFRAHFPVGLTRLEALLIQCLLNLLDLVAVKIALVCRLLSGLAVIVAEAGSERSVVAAPKPAGTRRAATRLRPRRQKFLLFACRTPGWIVPVGATSRNKCWFGTATQRAGGRSANATRRNALMICRAQPRSPRVNYRNAPSHFGKAVGTKSGPALRPRRSRTSPSPRFAHGLRARPHGDHHSANVASVSTNRCAADRRPTIIAAD